MKLRIFDSRQYIYAGVGSDRMSLGLERRGDVFFTKRMPCAGIRLLLDNIFKYGNDDLVFTFDRPPEVKRELYDRTFGTFHGYKGNRPAKDIGRVLQWECAEAMLRACRVNVVAVDGYEADDCIYSLVKQYADSYEHIYIHSRDSDLAVLVTDSVTVEPVCRQGKVLTMANWENEVDRNYIIRYNTLQLHKLIRGEASDNIPPIPQDMAKRVQDYILPDQYPKCGDQQYFRELVGRASGLDSRVMAITDLLLLQDIPKDSAILYEEDTDLDLARYFGWLVGCRSCRSERELFNAKGYEVVAPFIDQYCEEVM